MGAVDILIPSVLSLIVATGFIYCTWALSRTLNGRPVGFAAGFEEGAGNPEVVKQLLRQDVERMQSKMIAFTDTGADWYWREVREVLRRKLDEGKCITFVVYEPEFRRHSHEVIDGLARHTNADLYFLNVRPSMDLRFIDDNFVHLACHDLNESGRERRYWRTKTSGKPPVYLINQVRRFIKSYLRDARRIEPEVA